MSGQYPPGTVAMVRVNGQWYRAMRQDASGDGLWTLSEPALGQIDHYDYEGQVTEVRPLLVLDPEDREQVERLTRTYLRDYDGGVATVPQPGEVNSMQAALRSLLSSAKPEEPKGDGAVVVDAEGNRYVRIGRDSRAQWMAVVPRNPDRPWRYWSGIDAVRVLSEGIGEAE